jgi:hypothetical protein
VNTACEHGFGSSVSALAVTVAPVTAAGATVVEVGSRRRTGSNFNLPFRGSSTSCSFGVSLLPRSLTRISPTPPSCAAIRSVCVCCVYEMFALYRCSVYAW